MARYAPDIRTRRWVIFAPKRAHRPLGIDEKKKKERVVLKNGLNFYASCPLCPGNEKLTPPEVYRRGENRRTGSKWLVRVVPNKFPITDIHEVIIHSPDHIKDLAEVSLEQVRSILKAYKDRYQIHVQTGQVLIFNNKGEISGRSLTHPHSQLVVIPRQIKLDVLPLETVKNVILENHQFVVYCPEFSQWPYEVWIAKRDCCQPGHKDECLFGQIMDEEIGDLAEILRSILRKIQTLTAQVSYNFYIYPGSCWYLRIIPRLVIRAGFELGTGLHVNEVDPEEAARRLKRK